MGKIQHKCLFPNDETMTIRSLVMAIAFFYEYYHTCVGFPSQRIPHFSPKVRNIKLPTQPN
jgi:hypothetical protein